MKNANKGASKNPARAAGLKIQEDKTVASKDKLTAARKKLKQANSELSESKDEIGRQKKKILNLEADVRRLQKDAVPFDKGDQEHVDQHRRLHDSVCRLKTERDTLQRSIEQAIAVLRNHLAVQGGTE